MQKRGVARADQARHLLGRGSKEKRRGRTESNNVAEQTKLAQVELALNNLLAASKHIAHNGRSIAECQANDTDTRKSVESSHSPKVDQAKCELDNHAHHHSVDRDVELGVNNPPHLVARDTTITSKSVDSARRGSCAADTAEQTEHHEREEKTDGTAGRAHSVDDDLGRRLARCKSREHGLIGQDEDEGDEEDETTDGVEDNGADHRLRDLSRRVTNFFAHTIH